MKINIRVKTRSKKQKIIFKNNTYYISLINPAIKNKANIELINLLSKYYNISKTRISITSGHKNKNKICSITI